MKKFKLIGISILFALNILSSNSTYAASWAENLVHKTYTELFYTYPQVKAICYFNNSSNESPHEYGLYTNPRTLEIYNQLTSNALFLRGYGQTSPISYRNVTTHGLYNNISNEQPN
ncbi:hypothetical protein AN641_08725 [Candidatus Epulonipiscioides gigas]|nr:hypothetical protein AN641_08725 [Epulopiscium sp. SCG-C07WGA-EpuloA2]